jgi:hypothetical protein
MGHRTTGLTIFSPMMAGSRLSAAAFIATGLLALGITAGSMMMSAGAVQEEPANYPRPGVLNDDATLSKPAFRHAE